MGAEFLYLYFLFYNFKFLQETLQITSQFVATKSLIVSLGFGCCNFFLRCFGFSLVFLLVLSGGFVISRLLVILILLRVSLVVLSWFLLLDFLGSLSSSSFGLFVLFNGVLVDLDILEALSSEEPHHGECVVGTTSNDEFIFRSNLYITDSLLNGSNLSSVLFFIIPEFGNV